MEVCRSRFPFLDLRIMRRSFFFSKVFSCSHYGEEQRDRGENAGDLPPLGGRRGGAAAGLASLRRLACARLLWPRRAARLAAGNAARAAAEFVAPEGAAVVLPARPALAVAARRRAPSLLCPPPFLCRLLRRSRPVALRRPNPPALHAASGPPGFGFFGRKSCKSGAAACLRAFPPPPGRPPEPPCRSPSPLADRWSARFRSLDSGGLKGGGGSAFPRSDRRRATACGPSCAGGAALRSRPPGPSRSGQCSMTPCGGPLGASSYPPASLRPPRLLPGGDAWGNGQ